MSKMRRMTKHWQAIDIYPMWTIAIDWLIESLNDSICYACTCICLFIWRTNITFAYAYAAILCHATVNPESDWNFNSHRIDVHSFTYSLTHHLIDKSAHTLALAQKHSINFHVKYQTHARMSTSNHVIIITLLQVFCMADNLGNLLEFFFFSFTS